MVLFETRLGFGRTSLCVFQGVEEPRASPRIWRLAVLHQAPLGLNSMRTAGGGGAGG